MKNRKNKIYQGFQGLVCLLVLLTFVFSPSLHIIEHAFEDAGHGHSHCGHIDHTCSSDIDNPENRDSVKPSNPSPSAVAATASGSVLEEDCSRCRDMHLLSLNSPDLPAADLLSSLARAEEKKLFLSTPAEAIFPPRKQARAPPFPCQTS